jgi:hypothetical protein
VVVNVHSAKYQSRATYHFSNEIVVTCNDLHVERAEYRTDTRQLVDDCFDTWVFLLLNNTNAKCVSIIKQAERMHGRYQKNHLSNEMLVSLMFRSQIDVCYVTDGFK